MAATSWRTAVPPSTNGRFRSPLSPRIGAMQASKLVPLAWRAGPRVRSRLNQTLLHGPNRGLGSIPGLQLAQDVLHVFLDRLNADIERTPDFAIRETKCHMPQNLHFAIS